MRRPIRRWALGGWLFTALATATACLAADDVLERLERAYEQGRVEAAYRLAVEHRAAFEGRVRFDFYYGVACIDTGRLGEGVFALERVLMHRPDMDRARLELARGYLLLGEDRQAEDHFRTVLDHDPPPAVAAKVRGYLDTIERRRTGTGPVLDGYVETAVGYDSNVNSATDVNAVSILDGLFLLDIADESREQSDSYLRLAAGGQAAFPLPGNRQVFLGGSADRVYLRDEHAFETGTIRASGGLAMGDATTRLVLRGWGQRFYLDGERYQDSAGVDAGWRWQATARTGVQLSAQYSRMTYPDQPLRDSSLWLGGLGGNHLLRSGRATRLSAHLFGGREDADEDTDAAEAIAGRDLYGAGVGLDARLGDAWSLGLQALAFQSEYDAPNALFGEARDETQYQAEAHLDWEPTERWRLGPRLRYSRRDSNIDLYEYDRLRAELRVRYGTF